MSEIDLGVLSRQIGMLEGRVEELIRSRDAGDAKRQQIWAAITEIRLSLSILPELALRLKKAECEVQLWRDARNQAKGAVLGARVAVLTLAAAGGSGFTLAINAIVRKFGG